LTVPDREVIAHSVSQDLVSRLDRIKNGNPFETRSWGDSRQRAVSPAEFDFVDVAIYTNRSDSESLRRAREALSGNPFG
ncbi:MAG: hypothetical protein JO099_15035, partial [Acidobacteriia bacterium]|nr:hypothetical protein [Terriglobia bacterium]